MLLLLLNIHDEIHRSFEVAPEEHFSSALIVSLTAPLSLAKLLITTIVLKEDLYLQLLLVMASPVLCSIGTLTTVLFPLALWEMREKGGGYSKSPRRDLQQIVTIAF